MSMSRIASLFGLAGALGLIITVLVGPSVRTDYLVEASFVCLVLAGLFVLVYVFNNLWAEFNGSGNAHQP